MKDNSAKKQLVSVLEIFKRALKDEDVRIDENATSVIKLLKLFINEFLENEDYGLIPEFLDMVTDYLQVDENSQIIQVISNIELTTKQKQDLENKLINKFGSNIHVVFVVDESLLGGLQIKIGDKLIDLSINKKLEVLQRKLMN